MEQVTDEQLYAVLDDEMNSIAIIVKHMAGNMRSRFTDFLTSDGEKPDRFRAFMRGNDFRLHFGSFAASTASVCFLRNA